MSVSNKHNKLKPSKRFRSNSFYSLPNISSNSNKEEELEDDPEDELIDRFSKEIIIDHENIDMNTSISSDELDISESNLNIITPSQLTENNNNNYINNNNYYNNNTIEDFLNDFSKIPSLELINSCYIEDETILTYCIRNQFVDAIIALLSVGVDPNMANKNSVAPLTVASSKGNVYIMKYLINAGALVDTPNLSGSTALIQTAHFGHADAVKLLLENNATPDLCNIKGTSALMRASQEGRLEICQLLIDAKVDINKKNLEGMNSLMLASQRGHSDIVLLLIKNGVSMENQTATGSTALMLACKRGHTKCVEVLISMGVEIYMRDTRMLTAFDLAVKRNHNDILYLLDSQVQINKMQQISNEKRKKLLSELRLACLKGKLRINYYSRLCLSNNYKFSFKDEDKINIKLENDQFPQQLCKRTSYENWQWPLLLYRCMESPFGIFELISEYLPVSRIWNISKLKNQCNLAPNEAIKNMNIIMDEVIADNNIFNSNNQKLLLVKISRNPSLHPYLIKYWNMPQFIIDSLCEWSDIQSLQSRSNMHDVIFKEQVASEMLTALYQIIKWDHYRCNVSINNKFVTFSRYYQLGKNNNFENINIIKDNENENFCLRESYVDDENILRGIVIN